MLTVLFFVFTYMYGNVTISGEGWQKYSLCSPLKVETWDTKDSPGGCSRSPPETRQGFILPGSPGEPESQLFLTASEDLYVWVFFKSDLLVESLFTIVREVTLSDKLNSEELSFLALVQNISKASHTGFVTGIVNMKIECVFI